MNDDEKPPYLRWHPAISETGSFRGENLEPLNQRTMEYLHEIALEARIAKLEKGESKS